MKQHQCSYHESELVWGSRRKFLHLAALGGGAAGLLAVTGLWPEVCTAGHTEALLLSCMDFRLMDDIERCMSEDHQLKDKYDHIVLAGASLGALNEKYPAWSKTFWEHLGIAIELHDIHKVILMDHRDCGAYKVILGEDFAKDPPRETEVHAAQLKKLKAAIQEKYPKLEVELLLMALDGKVETIT